MSKRKSRPCKSKTNSSHRETPLQEPQEPRLYGLYSTLGQVIAGNKPEPPEKALDILQSKSATLYMEFAGNLLTLGSAAQVQIDGGRPHTVCYIEIIEAPKINNRFFNEYDSRFHTILSDNNYILTATDQDIVCEKKEATNKQKDSRVTPYSLGRLLMGKTIECFSPSRKQSEQYLSEITTSFHPYLQYGYTILISTIRRENIDIWITPSSDANVDIDIQTQTLPNITSYIIDGYCECWKTRTSGKFNPDSNIDKNDLPKMIAGQILKKLNKKSSSGKKRNKLKIKEMIAFFDNEGIPYPQISEKKHWILFVLVGIFLLILIGIFAVRCIF